MRGISLGRLLLLATFATCAAWPASITSLNAGPQPPGTPPVPAVTAITSGSLVDQFVLYINGSFNPNASNVVNWTDPTAGTTSLSIFTVSPTQIVAFVLLPQYQTPVASPVPVTITVVEPGLGPSNPAIFTINPPMKPSGPLLPIGTVGQAYNANVVSFGTPPYTIVGGPITTVPPGTSVQSTPGGVQLAGVPTTAGVFILTGTISDFWGNAITSPPFQFTVQIVANAVLTSLSPPSDAAGSPGLTLTINGSGFESPNAAIQSPGSLVQWTFNGSPVTLVNTSVTPNQLQATVPAALLTTAGLASVSVLQPNDFFSNALPFTILPPVITGLSPGSIAAGSATFPLSITGSSFLATSAVTFGGNPVATTFVNGGLLTASIPASLVKSPSSVPVRVANPGGNVSAPLDFTVTPNTISLSPSSIAANSPAFLLTVNGSNFSAGSTISFNGTALPTTFVNSGAITTTVPTSLIGVPGSYPVVVVNPGNSASPPATFTVTAALSIVTTSLGSGTAGSQYTSAVTGRGGNPPFTWSVTGLPAALAINPQSGIISGVALQGGTFTVTVNLQDSVGGLATARFSLVIAPPPVTISTGGLPNGTVGVPYAGTIGATGGNGPYTYSLGGGSLPDGLSLNSGGSVIGTPTAPGTFSFGVNVTDSTGAGTGRSFTITIAPAPLVVTGPPPSTGGTAGTPINITFGGTGGVGPYRCTEAGPLPPGTTFANCTLTGTPTAPGTYTFRVTITDSTGVNATRDVTIVIAPPGLSLSGTVGNGQVGVAYAGQLTAAGGVPPYTYSISGLPDGLSTSAAGAITGTPATAGQYTVGGSVTDAAGAKANATFNLTIAPAGLTITTTSLPDGAVNSAYSASLSAAGGVKPYTWSVSGLPDGLSSTAAGAISGMPSSAGQFTVSVSVKDAAGGSAAQRFTVTIAPLAITITSTTLANGTVGTAYSAILSATGGAPPFTWSATGLPGGLTISAGGSISGTPAAPGSFTITATVKDSVGTTASKSLSLTIGLPPTPPLNFSGITSTSPPLQQPQLTVSLGTPYPADVVVTLTLTFAADSGPDDPAIVFSTGGRTARITIPAGSTVGASSVGVQTGSVAGLITITAQLQATSQDVTPTPAPQSTIRIAATAPIPTTVTAARNSTGFTVTVTGYVTDREITQAIFTFNAAPGGNLQTTSLTVPVDTLFASYFSGASATPFGGQFTFIQAFTINGNANAIVSVTLTMVNKIGQSTPVTVNLN